MMPMSPRKEAMKKFREGLKKDNKTDYGSMLPKDGMSVEVVGKKPEDIKKGLEVAKEILPEIENMKEEAMGEKEEEDEVENEVEANGKALSPDILDDKSDEELIDLMHKIHEKLGMK